MLPISEGENIRLFTINRSLPKNIVFYKKLSELRATECIISLFLGAWYFRYWPCECFLTWIKDNDIPDYLGNGIPILSASVNVNVCTSHREDSCMKSNSRRTLEANHKEPKQSREWFKRAEVDDVAFLYSSAFFWKGSIFLPQLYVSNYNQDWNKSGHWDICFLSELREMDLINSETRQVGLVDSVGGWRGEMLTEERHRL